MYSFIEGKLVEKRPAYAVINCSGVGYLLNISLHTYSMLPEPAGHEAVNCRLLTHLIVREDAMVLFGFASEEERELFRQLITVSGIGANTARLIFSSLTPEEIRNAIVRGDISLIQSVKGIGSKTAQRIIVDLKDKLGKTGIAGEFLETQYNTKKDEALSGLIMLGFNKALAEKTIDKIIRTEGSGLSVEDLIKNALRML
jgi:holliday junction DNA helicase RuvA